MNKFFKMSLILLALQLTNVIPSEKTIAQNRSLEISGSVFDKTSGDPIEYASIAVYALNDSMITGTVSLSSGKFFIKIPNQKFYLKISFMGYEPVVIKEYNIRNNRAEVADIFIVSKTLNMDEVVVRGEKSVMEFKLDKRVFNVGKDLTSAGGSALDVLNNVPSVNVDIEGTVSLRGNSNVQMMIDGKPSVLTEGNSLGTITADMIDKVEVVTNPSAKYDAEGTSGIINIILKKDEKTGLNGAVTVNVGTPTNYSVGLSMNKRTEKFNLFSQFGVGKRKFPSEFNSETINRNSATATELYSDGTGNKYEQFYNVVLGTDYNINRWNVVTLSGHFAYEIEDEDSKTNYNSIINNNSEKTEREEITEATNPKYEFELSYKKSFEGNKDKSLTASATGSFFGKDKESDFINRTAGSVVESEKVKSDFSETEYSFQTDYVDPISKTSTIEAGAKYDILNLGNDYSVSNLQNNVWVVNPEFVDNFNYNEHISAAYVLYGYEPGKFGVKLGVRAENTDIKVTSDKNDKIKKNYLEFFPSAHTSFKFSKQLSLQLGYSRRIHRARWTNLIPISFFSFRDSFNKFYGNPELKPEFTDAFEFSLIQLWDGVSFNTSLFYRATNNIMTDITTIENNVTITTVDNIGKRSDVGLEINGKADPISWLAILFDSYFSAYNRTGQYEDQNYDFNSSSWSGRLTLKLKLPLDIDMEFLTRYRSEMKDIQFTYKSQLTADFGIKKKILGGRGVINLSARDVFNSRERIGEASTDMFYRYSKRKRKGPQIVLGFSYGFGDGDAMEFSGQKRF